MAILKTKTGEITVSTTRVVRMADRMYRLGGEGRRQNFLAKARKRMDAGPPHKSDAATILAGGG